VARSHNLTDETYAHIVKLLGRQPTLTEVGIFGVMFSEHCSYCSSRLYLKQFPTTGSRVLVAAGKENAGLVDIGEGLAVAFKVESHNHPSAVEPHEGAATGVGGIIRDIFTMGARPIALLDSLRFGPFNGHARNRFLFDGVIRGIADYGNCVGIPTVGGEISFDETYRDNPLVNVMCIGLVKKGCIAHAHARGAGNPVLYAGSSTGRDGLGGASFASRELTESSQADRPAVQIGDPFTEKCLIEATLEALATGDVVGIQDMGAAGLTCSTCETAARGGCGIEIDVARVPRREEGMTPYEVMLSESQERMLLIVKRGKEKRIENLFGKWGLNAVEIGRVTNDGLMRVMEGNEVAAEIPARALADEAPIYHRPLRRPRYLAKAQRLTLKGVPQPKDYTAALLQLLGSPSIADKSFVYEQYDHMVQTNTVVLPGLADAAVLRIKGTDKLLAATTDGNGRYCYLNPCEGGKLAVAEAARNLVCVGAKPLAVTDCLNFGNPQDPEIMWQFKECVRGIAEACRAFKTPVTGGNVSFYNEGPRGAIDPTPVIGMIGLIEFGVRSSEFGVKPTTTSFKDEGDIIILLGKTREELGGSEYLALIHGRKAGKPPRVDLKQELALQRLVVEAASRGLLKSAHDCSDGGLAVALAECCIMEPERLIGATVQFKVHSSKFIADTMNYELRTTNLRADALLFGESSGRIVISCEQRFVEQVQHLATRYGVPVSVIGGGGGSRLSIEPWINESVDVLNDAWRTGLEKSLQK
jgi:phosphoribosylformylglycinamidine synthase